jgi:hypothetical protein
MMIENHSGVERLFTVEADGMGAAWIRINRREVRLSEDEQTEVLISVRPPRASDTRPGRYPLRIRVAYKDDPTQVVEVLREVDVLVYSGLAMAMKTGTQAGQYFLAVQNQGNQPLELTLDGYQVQQLLRFQFSPAKLSIEPGATQQIALRVNPTRGAGQGRSLAFAVVARAADISGYQAPLLGYYDPGKSKSTGWMAGLFGVPIVGLLVIIGGLAALAGLWIAGILPSPAWPAFGSGVAPPPLAITATPRPPSATPPPTAIPTPVIDLTSFSAAPGEVVFGTIQTIVFAWQLDRPGNVKDTVIREDSTGSALPLTAAAPSIDRFEIAPSALVDQFGWGEHSYTLTVTGVDGVERSASFKVKISPVTCNLPPAVEIDPQPGQTDGTTSPAPVSREIVIGGRTGDSQWVWAWSMATHQPLGWVAKNSVRCPLTPELSSYIVVTPAPPVTTTAPAG